MKQELHFCNCTLESRHLKATTIDTFVLTLCTAAADNEASAGNMEGYNEGQGTPLCPMTIVVKAKFCRIMPRPH